MKANSRSNKGALGRLLLAASIAMGVSLSAGAAEPDPDRYIVSFLDVGKGKAALKAAGARIELELAGHEAAAAHIPARALNGLRNNPHIEYIEADAPRYPMAQQTTPYGITMVQADQLAFGGGVKVCIIDSGYYKGHVDLPKDGVTGKNDIGGSGDPFADGCGHGTHVAGTIAALDNGYGVVGVNSTGGIGLHIVKVFGDGTEGNCDWTYSSSLVAALDECKSQGSNIVSMSLGGGFKSRTEDRAFAQAFDQGVLSIAAAGNDGNTRMSYPASYASVMSVAAVDANKVVAAFSQKNDQVEIAAPGVGVLSTLPIDVTAEIAVGGTTYAGEGIEYAAKGSASGAVVDGGLCDSVGFWDAMVVMCERGSISFYDKVMNVQTSGGSAAVIYNNVPGGFAGTLGDGNSSTIPAISLSQEDGRAIVGSAPYSSGNVVNTAAFPANGYAAWDGTSMATPHVSGVAALVWSNNPQCTNAQIRNALNMTAEDRGAAGRDTAYGYGLVQAAAADTFIHDFGCDGLGGGGGGGGGGGEICTDLGQIGATCKVDADCCSNTCKGKPDAKTCK